MGRVSDYFLVFNLPRTFVNSCAPFHCKCQLCKVCSGFNTASPAHRFSLQHRRGGEILVGPKVLPGGVPHDTTPDNITAKLENMPSPEDGELDGAAAYRVAKDVATACGYEFKVCAHVILLAL